MKISLKPYFYITDFLLAFNPLGFILTSALFLLRVSPFSLAMRTALVLVVLLAAIIAAALLIASFTGIAGFDSSRDKRCFLRPDPGPCEAAIPRFFLGLSGDCEEFLWGGCKGVAPFETLEECRRACGIRVVPIMSTFEGKIVYSTDSSLDTTPLKEDCTERGGTFNECGTTCAPGAEVCVDVCAFTCELP